MVAPYHGDRTNETVQPFVRQRRSTWASHAAKEGRSLLKLANNIHNKEVKTNNIRVDNRAAELWTQQPCQPSKLSK